MAGVSGVSGASPSGGQDPQALAEKNLDQQFQVSMLNTFQQFGQQLPGNVSPSSMVSQMTEKAKSGSNQDDPASSDLDTGVP